MKKTIGILVTVKVFVESDLKDEDDIMNSFISETDYVFESTEDVKVLYTELVENVII